MLIRLSNIPLALFEVSPTGDSLQAPMTMQSVGMRSTYKTGDGRRESSQHFDDDHGSESPAELLIAKVIEFSIPKNFRRPMKRVPEIQRGKLLDFCPPTKRSAYREPSIVRSIVVVTPALRFT